MKTLETLKTRRLLRVSCLETVSVRCSVSEWCYQSELRYIVKYLYSVFIATRCTVPTLLLHSSNFEVSCLFKICRLRPLHELSFVRDVKLFFFFFLEKKKYKKQSVKLLIWERLFVKCVQMKGAFFFPAQQKKKLQ